MATSQKKKLVKKFDGLCHYCGEKTNTLVGSPLQATIEHVVPRAFGGANSINNYVLACSGCNNERGSQLFFCGCMICGPLIQDALEDPEFIEGMFGKIIKHNTPRVYKNRDDVWCVGLYHGRRHFDSWQSAMDFANNI